MMQPQMQHHPGFQHVRQHTPGAQNSPPMPNGGMPQFQRGPSPLPPGHPLSRPSSRASQNQPQHPRRPSSNLVPPQHQQSQGPPQQPSYAYTPNPPFYNPQAAAAAQMQQRPPQPGQPMPASTYPPPYPQQHPQNPQQGPTHQQLQQAYMQDNRRQSMPPAFPPQPGAPPQAQMSRHPSQDHLQPPQQHSQPIPSPQPPPQNTFKQEFASPQMPQPKPLPAHAKNHSIFTPIDDSRSLLAQHWGSTGNAEPPRSDTLIKTENDAGPRSASIDVAAMHRQKNANGAMSSPRQRPPQPPSRPMPKSPQPPQRAASATGVPPPPPTRSGTGQSDTAKRPRLRVAIPSENSGDEGNNTGSALEDTATSQPGATGGTGGGGGSLFQTAGTGLGQPAHGVVLPPPSPSHGALLSAGAQGPPNPFARPPPPMSTNPHALNRDGPAQSTPQHQQPPPQSQNPQQHQQQAQQAQQAAPGGGNNNNSNIETPISALPSRFMSDNLLPSPSTFYPEWGFGRSGGAGDQSGMSLPSPMNFQTPVVGNMNQGWGRSLGATGGGNGGGSGVSGSSGAGEQVDDERGGKRGAEEEIGGEGKRGRL